MMTFLFLFEVNIENWQNFNSVLVTLKWWVATNISLMEYLNLSEYLEWNILKMIGYLSGIGKSQNDELIK